jgi:hypothetical protein
MQVYERIGGALADLPDGASDGCARNAFLLDVPDSLHLEGDDGQHVEATNELHQTGVNL